MADLISAIIFGTVTAATPFILAGLGNLIHEKTGVLNLGTEGLMAIGAVVGFIVTLKSGSPWLGVCGGFVAGVLAASIHAFLTITLLASQVACGLALAVFGVGLAAFIGKPYVAMTLPAVPTLPIPVLSHLPIIGHGLFDHQPIVYLTWALVGVALYVFYKTRTGLIMRAIGESPQAAHAIGYAVIRYRYEATLLGGGLAGIGGTYLSVFSTPLWVENMVSGRGWISLALVVFAAWNPLRLVLGAYLFGGVMIAQFFIQGSGLNFHVPVELLSALPYLATIVVLIFISHDRLGLKLNTPTSLGQPFRPEG